MQLAAALTPARRRLIWIASTLFLGLGFPIYLFFLYTQLENTFSQQEQFVPTRIYSDITRVAKGQGRGYVAERLQALSYKPAYEGRKIGFRLHPIRYPPYLLPEGHLQLKTAAPEAEPPKVEIEFEDQGGRAAVKEIRIGGQESQDLYLEPELVAALSRAGSEKREIRTYLDWDHIPALIPKAIIAAEDQHFLEHQGFDPRGLARAIWVNLRTLSFAQGGSTLTQQLVKNLMARRGKNPFRKLNELFLAILLELKYKKEQILERYLNEVYLGQVGSFEVHGVAEGAKLFFGKKVEELNLGEIALMAGLIRGPGVYSPYRNKERAIERQHWVLKRMVETDQIAEEEMKEALTMPIRLAAPQHSTNKAPYFTDFVKAELIRLLKDRMSETEIVSAGFRVYTTLDVQLNSLAQRSVAEGLTDLEARLKVAAPDRLEGALASVDHATGYIRALIGGRSYAQSNFNRILNMKRQVGSTFKPFVYLTAFRESVDPAGVPYTPAHPAEDAPWKLTYDGGKQQWTPRNYEKEFLGWTTFRTGLAHSINTITAKLGWEVGIPEIVKTAHALGIESELPAVPSLSLGVAELSPIELLKAYATLANRGIRDDLTVVRGITQEDGTGYARFVFSPKQVIEAAPIDLITSMLASVFKEGTARFASAMGFDRPAAGKTGTTSHHRDAWFAGYTPQLTTVVWVGMDIAPIPAASSSPSVAGSQLEPEEPQPRVMLTGASAALPIWVAYMKRALAHEPSAPFPESDKLVRVTFDTHTGQRASFGCPSSQTVEDYALAGAEPTQSTCEPGWPATPPASDPAP